VKACTILAATLAILTIAGCSSQSSPPKPSAAAACKDFNSWLAATGVDVTSGKDGPILASAVKAAPSGNLYQDMSTLQSNVQSATAAKGSGLFTGERLMALEDAQQVQTDCSSVNPSS
jgi:hypothetical protein